MCTTTSSPPPLQLHRQMGQKNSTKTKTKEKDQPEEIIASPARPSSKNNVVVPWLSSGGTRNTDLALELCLNHMLVSKDIDDRYQLESAKDTGDNSVDILIEKHGLQTRLLPGLKKSHFNLSVLRNEVIKQLQIVTKKNYRNQKNFLKVLHDVPIWLKRWCVHPPGLKRHRKRPVLQKRSWTRYTNNHRLEYALTHGLSNIMCIDAALNGPNYAVMHTKRNHLCYRALKMERHRIGLFLGPSSCHVHLLVTYGKKWKEEFEQMNEEIDLLLHPEIDVGCTLMPGGSDCDDY